MSDDAANSKDYILDKHFDISKDKIVHAKDKENHVQENDIIIDDAIHNHEVILEKYNIKNRNNLNFMPKQPWNNKLKSVFRGDILEIANKIKETGYQGTMNLMVTHGIFSKGIDIVAEYFDNIYTTNSIQKIMHNKVTQFNIF